MCMYVYVCVVVVLKVHIIQIMDQVTNTSRWKACTDLLWKDDVR